MAEPEELQQDPVTQRLRAWDAQSVAEVLEFRGERTLVVPRSHLRRVAEFLHGEPDLAFNFLSDITGVDRFPVEPRFELKLSSAFHSPSHHIAFARARARE